MALGKTAKRLKSVAERVEEMYERLQGIHERVAGLDDRIARIDGRVASLEERVAEQRAVLDAVAREHDIDPDEIRAGRSDEDADADGTTPATASTEDPSADDASNAQR